MPAGAAPAPPCAAEGELGRPAASAGVLAMQAVLHG